ncbi:MAG: AAA family ATPase, partial [Candidatus Thiodiazotropha taylori]
TGNNGRKADFRNVVIVMTTNAGAQEMSRSSIGFSKQDHTTDGMEVIKKMFTPEFRNRLDAIIQFSGLTPEHIAKVVDKFVFELEGQLQEKHVNLIVEAEARVWLAEHGYDPQMGARPMARLIQDEIKKPLAEELLFGKLSTGGAVRVDVAEDKLVFDIEGEQVADTSIDEG